MTISDDIKRHGPSTIAKMVGAGLFLMLLVALVDLLIDTWRDRDVVTEIGITAAAFDGATLTFSGWMAKRGCDLASPNPFEVVSFWREDRGGLMHRLDFNFGAEPGRAARPPGTTAIDGWRVTLDADARTPEGAPGPTEIVGIASHICGSHRVGPREFMRITPAEAIRATETAPVIAR